MLVIDDARPCPCCGVGVGELHQHACTVERDPDTGLQLIRQPPPTRPRLPWTGEWPGEAECREFGWYARPVPGQGWVRCEPRQDASPDINRLYSEAIWDAEAGRFRRRQ